jgi:hypothetical protein
VTCNILRRGELIRAQVQRLGSYTFFPPLYEGIFSTETYNFFAANHMQIFKSTNEFIMGTVLCKNGTIISRFFSLRIIIPVFSNVLRQYRYTLN